MRPILTFKVIPSLPPRLERLRDLAHNLRWAWNQNTISLFRRLDSDLWEASGHNPVLMLGVVDQRRLEEASTDDGFLAHLDRASEKLDTYMAGESTWFRRTHGHPRDPLVAYFSAEFGVTECLSIFAGGLGILAGDHLKSASDLGVPLIGVGLLYQQGYFRQYLNEAGWQQENYVDNDFHNLPLALERDAEGAPVTIHVEIPGRRVEAQVWRAQVGRTPLFLLDANVPANAPEDRNITYQLYGGDQDMRIRQEILLGVGGYRALEALGLRPSVYHMNEGHSAFLGLERVLRIMENGGLSFSEAREVASAGLVFTTHTPVEAGHDYFPPPLVDRYLAGYYGKLGLSRDEFLALGRKNPADANEPLCMTVLSLRLAAHSNGVSRLHGEVSRRMWQRIWPGVPEEEIPIGHVTNGVQFRSWISHEMDQLYDRYLGPQWQEQPSDEAVWGRVDRIPAEELWHVHELRRERLVGFARRRLRAQLRQRGAPLSEVEAADEVLDPGALTIGFGRRFATYKRATLLLRDADRLANLLNDPQRPAQVIFAGKAHPRDDAGKELIRQIVALARTEPFRRRLVFLEDYDLAVARYMVQGSDVWLNNPCRPLEASGTSGMKAAANGVLNLSTLDGWWDEAWIFADPKADPIGWSIGRGEEYDNPAERDRLEAESLYDVLERDVVPTFYTRGADRLPRRWIARMKSSIGSLCHFFNTHRMVREYTEKSYLPAAARHGQLNSDGMARARSLASWKARLRAEWPHLKVEVADGEARTPLKVGEQFSARARVRLGRLSPEDVAVELYMGRIDSTGELMETAATAMQLVEVESDGICVFQADAVACCKSGLHGYTIRVVPRHPDLPTPFLPGLITWST